MSETPASVSAPENPPPAQPEPQPFAERLRVVLLRQGFQLYAISATCPHAGGPLDEGTLQGDVVECPWHSSRFCMRDGRVLTGPSTVNAPRYEVRVRNNQVELKRTGDH